MQKENKKVRLFVNGKRKKDVYLNKTKWEIFKYKIKRFFRKVFITMAIALTLLVVYKIGNITSKNTVYETKEVVVEVNNLAVKIDELKDGIVEEIKQCESGGKEESFGLVTFDPNQNNKKVEIASFGSLQFKKSTVIFYYKQLYNKDITGKEAILIALDDERASELARDIIFIDGGVNNWYNCAKKLNSSTKLETIKSLGN